METCRVPLMPLGSYYNPVLFEILGRPVTFQSQSSWLLMTPIVYYLRLYLDTKTFKNDF